MKNLVTEVNAQLPPEFDGKILLSYYNSPLGDMIIGVLDEGLCLLEFHDRIRLGKEFLQLAKELGAHYAEGGNEHSEKTIKELDLYFKRELQHFTVPFVLTGTEFQRKVFESLKEIPFGRTVTYKDQSLKLGDMKAIRAVATANGVNRIAIMLPCHRVIGSDGSLVGYAGGIWRKKALLELESGSVQMQLSFE